MQATTNHDDDDDDSGTTITQLPPALTAHILQLVPQQQRLSFCALVCRAWQDAAAQATVCIDCKLGLPAAAEALVAWLQQHGEGVQSLQLVSSRRFCKLQLPWALLSQLQSLHLTRIQLPANNSTNSSAAAAAAGSSPLGGGSSGSGGQTSDMQLLPRLTQLHLQDCRMHSRDSLLQLANSPRLTSFILETKLCGLNGTDDQPLSPALLERLPQLLVLRLPRTTFSCAAIKHVAGMDSLQHLQLAVDEGSACGDCLTDLPSSSLTRLQLDDWRCEKFEQPTLPPQLQQLTALQQLQLERCSLLPAVLASIPQLQHLDLQDCILLPCEPASWRNPAATAALLGALQQLTRLQHLEIQYSGLDTAGLPPQQWAALTASTQLTHLCLNTHRQPLPQGAAQHMFPAGRQLQKLVVQSFEQWRSDWCLDGPDLGSIISCCPQLHELGIVCTVRAGADVSALLQLPSSCTALTVGGDGFADAAASVVAQLTQLRELIWHQSPELTDAGLQRLTALQGLTELHVRYCARISSRLDRLDLESTDIKGPVWQQLQAAVVAASML